MDKETFCLYLSRFLQVADLSGMTGLGSLPPELAIYKPIIARMLGGQDPAQLLRQGLQQQAEQLTDEQARWVLYGTQPTRPD